MTARTLDRSGALPLWEQLLADLRHRLDRDEFADAFPGELALVAEYGVSRHTVREAVRRLRDEGLVIAGRGRTPRRAEPAAIEQPLGEAYSLFTAVEATGSQQEPANTPTDTPAGGFDPVEPAGEPVDSPAAATPLAATAKPAKAPAKPRKPKAK